MRHGVGNGGASADELEEYEGIVENIEDGDYTQKDVAEDYGKFEAVNLVSSGTIVDHNEREFNIRDSRIPEAEKTASYMNNGLKDAGKAAAYAAGNASLPVAMGYMAVDSGGDPFWVGTSIFSTALVADSISEAGKQAIEGIARRLSKSSINRRYDFGAVAEEDYELNIVDDEEFRELAFAYADDDDIEVRQPSVTVHAAKVGPAAGGFEEEEEELSEEMLEEDRDEFE